MNTTTVYAEIVKAERNEAGDLVVVGKATGPDLDLDKQICDPAWLAKAMPEWFSTGGNIREQHSSIAAGVATELANVDDSWMVTATIVDKSSAEKVEKGVLKGYSIGIADPRVIKDAAAPGGRIVGGAIVETSLVDRPCNPTAMLSLAKAAKPGMQVKASALDSERMLVKVEEFTQQTEPAAEPADEPVAPEPPEPAAPIVDAKALVAARKAADPDLGKGSPQEDIAGAQAAIAAIAQLIVSEAGDLAMGDLGEACDIQDLLCAIDALRWFICGERAEAENAAEDAVITIPLAAEPDTPKTPEPVVSKATGPDITELVKTAVAEANKASEGRVKALEAEIAKVKALPVSGGPVLTRTAEDTQKAAHKDAQLTKAAHYRQLADQMTDPVARKGYRELAAAIDADLPNKPKE